MRGTLGTTPYTVHGTLALKSGNLQVDLSTGTAGGEVVADATSGNSGNDESARFGEWRPKNPSNSLLQVDHSVSIELELKGTIQAQAPQWI